MKKLAMLCITLALLFTLTSCSSSSSRYNSGYEQWKKDNHNDRQYSNDEISDFVNNYGTSTASEEAISIVDIASGEYLAAAVFSDGTATLTGQCIAEWGKEKIPNFSNEVETWRNIIQISVGDDHVVGLKKDGTVVAAGSNREGQCNVSTWKNVVFIDAGPSCTTAITADGELLSVGTIMQISLTTYSSENIVQNVYGITNAKMIASGSTGTVILHHDGTCSVIGSSVDGAYSRVRNWEKIRDIAHYSAHTLALKEDGTVESSGATGYGRCDVGNWRDIIQIDCGKMHSVGLKSDGTVIATGRSDACKVQTWKNIVKICAGGNNTLGLTANGTVVYCGSWTNSNCDIDAWNQKVESHR